MPETVSYTYCKPKANVKYLSFPKKADRIEIRQDQEFAILEIKETHLQKYPVM